MLFVSPPEVFVHLVAPFQSLFGRQNVVASAFSMKNHSRNLGVLMPEYRLYFKQRNKAEDLSDKNIGFRISWMFFISSLNTVSSSRVQHNTYAFSLHIQFTSFLKRRGPKTFLVIVRKEAPYRCFLSLSQHNPFMQVSDTHIYIYMLILEE